MNDLNCDFDPDNRHTRLALELCGAAILVTESDETVSFMNTRCAKLLDITPEEVEGKRKWTEFLSFPNRMEVAASEGETSGDRGPVSEDRELTYRHKNGTTQSLAGVLNAPGEDGSMVITLSSFSARKELEESRRQISDVREYIPAIICEVDLNLRLISVNNHGLDVFGFTEEDVRSGIDVLDLIHPDCKERLIHDFHNIFAGDYGNFVEHKFIAKHGNILHLIVNSVPLREEEEIVGIRSYVVDVTARRKAEFALRASEARFRGMFAASPIGIALFDGHGVCSAVNGSFRALFGLKDSVPPRDIPANLSAFVPQYRPPSKKSETTRIQTRTDWRFVEENGELKLTEAGNRFLEWHLTSLGTDTVDEETVLAQVVDITEEKRREEERMRELREEADSARKALDGLRKELGEKSSFSGIVGRSEPMQKIFDILPEMAQASTTVLITGESGTGKERIARSLHELGPRKKKPFIAINCSALPDNLLESELFGYKAGAFTDAKRDKPGKFSLADGGTIFLDEIGDISPAMQAKLLRVLQEKTFEPLGAVSSKSVDVRVVTATNRDLPNMVREGGFREDLYYRIKVLSIKLPALRERRRDIPLLCDRFIEVFNDRYTKNITSISNSAMDHLLTYHYPGNIRELENALEHAFIFCKGETIEIRHLPPEIAETTDTPETSDPFEGIRNFEDLERQFLQKAIERAEGNKLKTARDLGIHKTTLFRKLKALGLG